MWVVLLPNDVLTVTILPESLYEALVILAPYTNPLTSEWGSCLWTLVIQCRAPHIKISLAAALCLGARD